jgi:hypothetical protein
VIFTLSLTPFLSPFGWMQAIMALFLCPIAIFCRV